jgi:pimeloyl-ACP methyl ester carboxylesterase
VTNLAEETRDSLVTLAHGISVAVRVQGEGDPLLLLNGFTRSLENWGTFVDELPGRMIISFDSPGVGDSPVPRLPLSIAHLADVAASVLDHLGVARADVLGFSYGGFVAQQMAVSHPGRIRRLVLVSTSCGLGSTFGKVDPLERAVLGKGATEWPHVLGALWNSMAFATWSSISFLGAIDSPTLVVCGSDDTVAPPANSRSLAQRIPDASLVMIEGGHDLQLAEPATRLAKVVDRFLVREDKTPHSTATNDVALSKEMI